MESIREADFVADARAINAIDRSFETNRIYRVVGDGDAMCLETQNLSAPLVKTFPLDDLSDPARPYDRGWLAVGKDGRCLGFAATSFDDWNRRLVLWHLYVDQRFRRRGVGRRLLDCAARRGRAQGARHLWLETSSINVPGVAAYRALGFRLTGLDLTLYDSTPADGEVALFLSRPLD
jgi:ribosomal protein S18 acetylase RimI-like enzyme